MIKKVQRRFRTVFLTGFLVTLPIALTFFILNFLFSNLDALSPIFTHWLILAGAPLPEGYRIPFLGVIMTFVIVFFIGALTTNIFGKKLLHLWETIVEKIPFVRRVYKGTKQVVSSFTSVDTKSFTKVVPSEVIELDMTIEEGIKYVVSGGLVTPEDAHKLIEEANG